MHKFRTHYCHEVNSSLYGSVVKISGWITRIRDHGEMVFIDIRDFGESVQCILDSQVLNNKKINLSVESVVTVTGEVVMRPDENINTAQESGNIEIRIKELTLVSKSKSLPFQVCNNLHISDDMKVKYRFLDLRRTGTNKIAMTRSNIIRTLRDSMHNIGFTEFHTPLLTSSSPEGARDFIVPSRHHKGKFFALPQAPQICKQLLMGAGFENYFQIAPCFRDEDGRADRTPCEFYQLDIEMSFAKQADVINTTQDIILEVFRKYGSFKVDENVVCIKYEDAINKYGTDKPDLRIPLFITKINNPDITVSCFEERGLEYRCIRIPGAANNPRKWFHDYEQYAKSIEMHGLGYIKYIDGNILGPMGKFISDHNAFIQELNLDDCDVVLFIADEKISSVLKHCALLIKYAAYMLPDLIGKVYRFCWIVDYPFFEMKDGKISFSHNPFSMPQGGIEALESDNKLAIKAHQYDFVCNGAEIASGAERNYSLEIMKMAFNVVGYSIDSIKKDFYPLYKAMHYGLPPHAGIAFGIERIIMLCCNLNNIKDVVLFPADHSGASSLFKSPSTISEDSLHQLGIRTND